MKIKLLDDSGIIASESSKSGFYFTPLPETVLFQRSTNYQSFNIISKGGIDIPKGLHVDEISWDGEFFGKAKKKEYIIDKKNYMPPNACVRLLKKLMNKNTVLTLVVSGTWINLDVTIASFEASPVGAFGNVKYSITFKRYRELQIKTTKESKKNGKKKTMKSRNKKNKNKNKGKSSGKSESKNGGGGTASYTVRAGDTLIAIARKEAGSAAKWTAIYNKNKATIEAAAKKRGRQNSSHGHWIYPGTKLTIPL